jgi:hypothetical protein
MAVRGVDGIVRTEPTTSPIESNGGSHVPAPVATEGIEFDWNGWLNAWLDNERSVMIPFYEKMLGKLGDELLDLVEPHLKKIGELELQVAQLHGGFDVLRGRGVPGVPRVRGTYCAVEIYAALDIVALNGSSFIAREDNPGPCPGAGWQLLASAGSRGPRGQRGQQGDRGVDGATLASISFDAKTLSFVARMSDGSRGPEISLKHIVVDLGIDPTDYSLKLTLNDGSEMRFSLRGLFEKFFRELEGR